MPGPDPYEKGAPVMFPSQPTRASLLASLARAVVSLTLLAVLLVAFGAALAGWFLRGQLQTALREEIERTPPQAQLVVEYRDQLEAAVDHMSTERAVDAPPDVSGLYVDMMARRGDAGENAWREGYDWQATIDLLQRDNTDLRWVNARMRERAVQARNPQLPRRNQQP